MKQFFKENVTQISNIIPLKVSTNLIASRFWKIKNVDNWQNDDPELSFPMKTL